MDHGGEAAMPTATVGSADLGMAGAVHGGEANLITGAVHDQHGAAAARRASFDGGFRPTAAAHDGSAESFARLRHVRAASGDAVPVAVFHREPGAGEAYANIGASWRRQLGPVGVVLVGLQLSGGVVQVNDSSLYSALQPRPGAQHGVVLAAQLPGGGGGGAVYSGDYARRLGAGRGEVLVDLLPDDYYGYYTLQPRPGAGRGEVFVGSVPDGVGVLFDDLGSFAQQTLPGTGRADGIAGALRNPNLGAEYDVSGALADDNRGMAAERLHRLLAFVGIGASFVAVNGLATGPSSPVVAFHLFVLLLAGLFLVILHVLRV